MLPRCPEGHPGGHPNVRCGQNIWGVITFPSSGYSLTSLRLLCNPGSVDERMTCENQTSSAVVKPPVEKWSVVFPAVFHLRLHLAAFRECQWVWCLGVSLAPSPLGWTHHASFLLSLLLFCSFPSQSLSRYPAWFDAFFLNSRAGWWAITRSITHCIL